MVCRFAQSWLRIGNFDILRARGNRKLIRQLSNYLAEHVFGGWDELPSQELTRNSSTSSNEPVEEPPVKLEKPLHLNRYVHLYRHIALLNAKTVAAWQAYGFTNGVLNTDNTSLLGLSLDFGPFAFIDNFDPSYTPNHDDHALRYAYRAQPSIIWWNLVRLGESLGELLGAGPRVDDREFVDSGVDEAWAPELIARAEAIIQGVGQEYRATFLQEYKRLMTLRLGLRTQKDSDFDELFSELLDTLEALELDFSHFFRRLSSVRVVDLADEGQRKKIAGIFFHAEGITGLGYDDNSARERIAKWLLRWRQRVLEDWGERGSQATSTEAEDRRSNGEAGGVETDPDKQREMAMKRVNPKFVARGWILDEIIRRVDDGDRVALERVMKMAEAPFEDKWGLDQAEEERWCGDVPRSRRGIMCSCSS